MRTPVSLLLLLTIHAVYGQLNFEGNPLTEDTVYTAEESHFAEKTENGRSLETPLTEDSYLLAAKTLQAQRSQDLKPTKTENDGNANSTRLSAKDKSPFFGESAPAASPFETLSKEVWKRNPGPLNGTIFGAQMFETHYGKKTESLDQTYRENAEPLNHQFSNPSESALAMFLNSKTPQESKMALDEYLTGTQLATQTANDSPASYQPHISDIVLPQQQSFNADQQPNQIAQQDSQYPQYTSSRYPNSQFLPSIGSSMLDQQPQFAANHQTGRNSNQVNRPGESLARKGLSHARGPPALYERRSFIARPPYMGPLRRAQSRVGSIPGFRKGPHGPYGPGGNGPELIYTKPPSFGNGNKQHERGQNPYEDAGAWFPDADHPPPDLNVYHSQLYSQSYDPHYYNHIAKYGKIKPHFYGKFPKPEESLLSELFRSFKKHGMKHVMHPMFLLGLGIPMITLMLSALVSSRSLARSSSGIDGDIHVTDQEIDEWTAKLRKALECHAESASESERMKCVVAD